MSLTVRPEVYELVLSCGHIQLASRPLPTGHGYPCWTACNSEQATPETVTEVRRHQERMNETFVVCSGISNGDMMHVQRVVDEANTKQSEPSVDSPLLPKLQFDSMLLTLALLPAEEVKAYISEIPATAAVNLLRGVEELIAEASGKVPELRRLAAAVKTRFDI